MSGDDRDFAADATVSAESQTPTRKQRLDEWRRERKSQQLQQVVKQPPFRPTAAPPAAIQSPTRRLSSEHSRSSIPRIDHYLRRRLSGMTPPSSKRSSTGTSEHRQQQLPTYTTEHALPLLPATPPPLLLQSSAQAPTPPPRDPPMHIGDEQAALSDLQSDDAAIDVTVADNDDDVRSVQFATPDSTEQSAALQHQPRTLETPTAQSDANESATTHDAAESIDAIDLSVAAADLALVAPSDADAAVASEWFNHTDDDHTADNSTIASERAVRDAAAAQHPQLQFEVPRLVVESLELAFAASGRDDPIAFHNEVVAALTHTVMTAHTPLHDDDEHDASTALADASVQEEAVETEARMVEAEEQEETEERVETEETEERTFVPTVEAAALIDDDAVVTPANNDDKDAIETAEATDEPMPAPRVFGFWERVVALVPIALLVGALLATASTESRATVRDTAAAAWRSCQSHTQSLWQTAWHSAVLQSAIEWVQDAKTTTAAGFSTAWTTVADAAASAMAYVRSLTTSTPAPTDDSCTNDRVRADVLSALETLEAAQRVVHEQIYTLDRAFEDELMRMQMRRVEHAAMLDATIADVNAAVRSEMEFAAEAVVANARHDIEAHVQGVIAQNEPVEQSPVSPAPAVESVEQLTALAETLEELEELEELVETLEDLKHVLNDSINEAVETAGRKEIAKDDDVLQAVRPRMTQVLNELATRTPEQLDAVVAEHVAADGGMLLRNNDDDDAMLALLLDASDAQSSSDKDDSNAIAGAAGNTEDANDAQLLPNDAVVVVDASSADVIVVAAVGDELLLSAIADPVRTDAPHASNDDVAAMLLPAIDPVDLVATSGAAAHVDAVADGLSDANCDAVPAARADTMSLLGLPTHAIAMAGVVLLLALVTALALWIVRRVRTKHWRQKQQRLRRPFVAYDDDVEVIELFATADRGLLDATSSSSSDIDATALERIDELASASSDDNSDKSHESSVDNDASSPNTDTHSEASESTTDKGVGDDDGDVLRAFVEHAPTGARKDDHSEGSEDGVDGHVTATEPVTEPHVVIQHHVLRTTARRRIAIIQDLDDVDAGVVTRGLRP